MSDYTHHIVITLQSVCSVCGCLSVRICSQCGYVMSRTHEEPEVGHRIAGACSRHERGVMMTLRTMTDEEYDAAVALAWVPPPASSAPRITDSEATALLRALRRERLVRVLHGGNTVGCKASPGKGWDTIEPHVEGARLFQEEEGTVYWPATWLSIAPGAEYDNRLLEYLAWELSRRSWPPKE